MRHVSLPASLILASASTFSAMGQQPSTQPAAHSDTQPTIRLVKPGASPRQLLRLAPPKGATGVIELTMHIDAAQTVNGAKQPEPPSPGVLMSFATVVTEITGDRIGYTFECVGGDLIADPAIPPAIIDVMRGGIQMVVGLHGTGVISDRGVSLDANVTRQPDMDEGLLTHALAIERLLDQITTPLPAEPVGIGGSWEITDDVEQDGLQTRETITCTLAASDGNTAEIAMKIRRHAGRQPVLDPNIPAGATAILTAYAFDGTGRTVLRLDTLHPAEGTINIINDSTMELAFGGKTHEVMLSMTIATALKSK